MPIPVPNDAPPWFRDFARDVEREIDAAVPLPPATVATLPDAAAFPYRWIWVSDESGGAQPAISDGTNWRRASDRAVVT